MLRGEFIRGDGRVIPNNITTRGAECILQRFTGRYDFTNAASRPNPDYTFVGLGSGVYTPGMLISDLTEPSILNGYGRIPLGCIQADWPVMGQINGEWYSESKPLIWTPAGPFDQSVSRLFLSGSGDVGTGAPWALSSAFDPIALDATTDINLRTFKYRIYLR